MKCSRVRDRLMDYASADLPPSEFQRMNEHLMGCNECRRELELAREASSALDVLSEEAPTPALVVAIREKIDRDRATRRPALVPRLAMGFSAAALIALILTGWLRYGTVDRKDVMVVMPRNAETRQSQSSKDVKTPPAPINKPDAPRQTVATADRHAPGPPEQRPGRTERAVPPKTGLGGEMTPVIVPEADSEPVILFALQPKEPEIYVTHLDAEDGGSPTELTVVREFDEGGNITSVTIEGASPASSSGDVVPASDRTHLLDVPPADTLEARHPDAGGITDA